MKQVAQQEAEKARYLVEKGDLPAFLLLFVFLISGAIIAEQMKLAAITTAEGDAQASKLLAKAFCEVFLIFARQIAFVG
jgi:hypothetical protein